MYVGYTLKINILLEKSFTDLVLDVFVVANDLKILSSHNSQAVRYRLHFIMLCLEYDDFCVPV